MKYQPAEIKIVLIKLSEALTAGRWETENTLKGSTVEELKP